MSEHLTEAETYELAVVGNVPGAGDVSAAAAAHAASCASCAAGVVATRRLLGDLENLPTDVAAPEDLGDRLAHRLNPAPGSAGWLLRVAAAALFFAAGALAHAGWSRPEGPVPDPAPMTQAGPAGAVALTPALRIQRAGTEYVATVAQLVADSSGISPAEMRTAREVGLAALYGAAFELTRLPVATAATSEIEALAKRAWTGESEESFE